MHRDRIIAKLNPSRRESRSDDQRPGDAADADPVRLHVWGKSQRAFGARAREALRQIREIGSRGH